MGLLIVLEFPSDLTWFMEGKGARRVVRDPSGCNTDPVYGLASANPSITVSAMA